MKDEGWLGNSYQNRSPRLTKLIWVAMMQANVGPTKLPGRGFSDTPPDHKSISQGLLWSQSIHETSNSTHNLVKTKITYSYRELYLNTVELGIISNISENESTVGKPQNFLNSRKNKISFRKLCFFSKMQWIGQRSWSFTNL